MKKQIKGLGFAVCLATTAILTGMAGCAGDRYHESTGEYIDDTTLTARVKSRLGDDPQYKYPDVNVTSFKGSVQLSGFVNTRAQKSRAGELARSVQNVREVVNNITVKE
jgi:hyperosmotically inducible protein